MNTKILRGNCLETLKTLSACSVRCTVTSPPYYGLRAYLKDTDPLKEYEIGSEATPELYIAKLVSVFDEVWRVLSDDGTVWLNLGDSYATDQKGGEKAHPGDKSYTNKGGLDIPKVKLNHGLKPKDLMMIPARVAIALQQAGWYLRSEIIWHKPNPMPESVKDRPTRSHEMIYLLTKSEKYYYDAEAIQEPAKVDYSNDGLAGGWAKPKTPNDKRERKRYEKEQSGSGNGIIGHSGYFKANGEVLGNGMANKRDVWTVTTKPYSGAHFATFPPDLIEPCILAGTSAKGHCPACGAPWERVTESEVTGEYLKDGSLRTSKASRRSETNGKSATSALVTGTWNKYITTGWQPTCDCNAGDPVPDTVLDPFGGSGTTAAVAIKHNRNAIVCELNENYIPLIEKRLMTTQPYLPMTAGRNGGDADMK